jgi:opacity protein-like surface antigen
MGSFKTFATAGTLVLSLGTAATAADFPGSYPSSPQVMRAPRVVDEYSSGWYLRGDVGYRKIRIGEVTNAAATPTFDDHIDPSVTLGGGVGYKWSWFRADLTADYGLKTKYLGSTAALAPDFSARVESVTALANIYGDLGTWGGLTPYIGAGLGGAYLRTTEFNSAFLPGITAVPGTGKWNLAWAWMAGVSYQVMPNVQIDLGYRRASLGNAITGSDSFGNQLTLKRLTADDIRIGFRYLID